MNRQLMPSVDQGEFAIKLNMPVGSTLEATAKAVSDVETWLSIQQDVSAVFSTIGLNQDQSMQIAAEAAINSAKIQVRLKKNRSISTARFAARLRKELFNHIRSLYYELVKTVPILIASRYKLCNITFYPFILKKEIE